MATAIRLTLTPKVKKTIEVLEAQYPTLTEVEIIKLGLSALYAQVAPITKFQEDILEAEEDIKTQIKRGKSIKTYDSVSELLDTLEK